MEGERHVGRPDHVQKERGRTILLCTEKHTHTWNRVSCTGKAPANTEKGVVVKELCSQQNKAIFGTGD